MNCSRLGSKAWCGEPGDAAPEAVMYRCKHSSKSICQIDWVPDAVDVYKAGCGSICTKSYSNAWLLGELPFPNCRLQRTGPQTPLPPKPNGYKCKSASVRFKEISHCWMQFCKASVLTSSSLAKLITLPHRTFSEVRPAPAASCRHRGWTFIECKRSSMDPVQVWSLWGVPSAHIPCNVILQPDAARYYTPQNAPCSEGPVPPVPLLRALPGAPRLQRPDIIT